MTNIENKFEPGSFGDEEVIPKSVEDMINELTGINTKSDDNYSHLNDNKDNDITLEENKEIITSIPTVEDVSESDLVKEQVNAEEIFVKKENIKYEAPIKLNREYSTDSTSEIITDMNSKKEKVLNEKNLLTLKIMEAVEKVEKLNKEIEFLEFQKKEKEKLVNLMDEFLAKI